MAKTSGRRAAGSGRTAVRARKVGLAAKARPAKKAKSAETKPVRPKKTYLGKKELAEFRQMLLAKRAQLLGDVSGMQEEAAGQKGSNLSGIPTDMADVGTDNFEREFTLGLLESEQALLREIDAALGRIGDRSYGICLGSGEPIPKARLNAMPWAKYTVDYARMLEKGLVRSPEEGAGQEDEAEQEDDVLADEEEGEVQEPGAGQNEE